MRLWQPESGDKSEELLPPPCTCPYFGDSGRRSPRPPATDLVIVPEESFMAKTPFVRRQASAENAPRRIPTDDNGAEETARRRVTCENSGTVVTWESPARRGRGTARTMVLTSPRPAPILRRSATLRVCRGSSEPPLLRYGSTRGTVRNHHSRNSSVMSRTSSRHGRIIRLEQKATKVNTK